MKSDIAIVHYLTQNEVDAGAGTNLFGGQIEIIDATSRQPTGVVYVTGAAGSPVTETVTASNINTVLASAGGAGWEKAQATTTSYVITRPTSGASLDLHIESGGTLAALSTANWAIPTNGVDQLKIRNFSGVTQTLTVSTGVGQFSGLALTVPEDSNPADNSYTIPAGGASYTPTLLVTIDPDGWVQAQLIGAEVSQAEFNTGLSGKMALYQQGHPFHAAATQAGHIATATSEFSTQYAGWKAFQQSPVSLNEWATSGAASASLTYQLPQATIFNRVVLMGRLSGAEYPTTWSIAGSNDGTTFTDIVASHVESLQAEVTKDFANTVAYKYYRFSYTAGTGSNIGLNHIRYFHNGINYLPADSTVINNTLTSTSTTDALSAAQGKALQDAKAPLASPTLTGTPAAPTAVTTTNTTQLATTAFTQALVAQAVQGMQAKDPVRVATTANITLSGTQTIDGVAVVASDRVLVKNQTTASQNGIYLVATGTWTRSADFDGAPSGEVKSGAFCPVQEGTINTDMFFELTTNGAITIGTTDLVFTQFTGAGQLTVTAPITKTGNTIAISAATTTASGTISSADQTKLNGIATSAAAVGSVVGTALGMAVAGTATTASRSDHVHPLPANVTTTVAGLMSGADKTKLDGVATSSAAVATTGTPVMDGTAALGISTNAARSDHVHASDTSRAPIASPTVTGTIQLDGSPILGDGANHVQRSFSDLTGATMLMTNTTGTGTSTIATTDVAARFVKPGTASTKSNAVMDVVVGSHTAGINSNTQVDFRLNNGGVNTPDVTILSLQSNGGVLANGSQVVREAAVKTVGGVSIVGTGDIPFPTFATSLRLMTPTDIIEDANRAIYLLADNLTLGAIATWPNPGTGGDFVQATVTSQPTVVTVPAMGNHQAALFADDFMETAANISLGTNYGLFAVFMITSLAEINQFILAEPYGGSTVEYVFGIQASKFFSGHFNGAWRTQEAVSPLPAIATPYILTTGYNGANISISVNGAAATTVAQTSNPILTEAGPIRLGRRWDGTTDIFDGHIACVVAKSGAAFTATEQAQLEGFAAWYYGRVAALPAGHIYKTVPPMITA